GLCGNGGCEQARECGQSNAQCEHTVRAYVIHNGIIHWNYRLAFEGRMTMLKLFYAVGSCALASHIALEEAGAEYEAVRLNFADGDQRKPEYLKVNPKGRVPALITDKGILTETPAILAYLAQVFPKAALAPRADPFAFARVQAFNSYLCSTAHVNLAHAMRGSRWADEPSSL